MCIECVGQANFERKWELIERLTREMRNRDCEIKARTRIERICLVTSLVLFVLCTVLLVVCSVVSGLTSYLPVVAFSLLLFVCASVYNVLVYRERIQEVRKDLGRVWNPNKERILLPKEQRPNLSDLSSLADSYSKEVLQFCVKENLTLSEIEEFLGWLPNQQIILSKSCSQKIRRYSSEGEGFFSGFKGRQDLMSASEYLSTVCPFYLFQKMRKMNREQPSKPLCEALWFKKLKAATSLYAMLFFRVVSRSDYEVLVQNSRNGSWDKMGPLCLQIRRSLEEISLEPWSQTMVQDRILDLFFMMKTRSRECDQWMRDLCEQGLTWEEISLLNKIGEDDRALVRSLCKLVDKVEDRGDQLSKMLKLLENYETPETLLSMTYRDLSCVVPFFLDEDDLERRYQKLIESLACRLE